MKLPETIRREDLASYKAEHPTLSTTEVAAKFREEIQSHGLEPQEVIESGKFHRFPGTGKRNSNTAGWCKLFNDGQGGSFGDWSTGLNETWFVNSNARKSTSPEQIRLTQQEAARAKKKWQEEEAARHAQAATKAQAIWDQAQPAVDWHPYLKQKRIKPHNLRATANGELLAPVYDRYGKLSSIQKIFEKPGNPPKLFHKGSATGGDRHFVIGGPDEYLSGATEGMETICIAEGVATAASIHEATGYPTVVAFSAYKLEPVARLTRERHPNAHITVCADNDAGTEAKGGRNPGKEEATKAARMTRAYLAIPTASEGESIDLNDLAVAKGTDAVKETIKRAMECLPMEPVAFLPSANDDEIPKEDYPLQEIPELLRNAITEVHNFTQTPMSMASASAISVISLAAQDKFNMERAEGLSSPIGLFFLTIAESGERKTTNDKMFLKPVHEFESEAEEKGKAAMQKYRREVQFWKQKSKKEIEDGVKNKQQEIEEEIEEPEQPKIPHLIYQDATPEALLWELHTAWRSGGVITSEGSFVIGSHGMRQDSLQKNLATYNQLWDGIPVRVDRRTSESFTVRDARLAMSLQVQEEPLREFMNRNGGLAREMGFLARCLITHPESTKGTRLFKNAPEDWPELSKYSQALRQILGDPQPLDDWQPRRTLKFDEQAQKLWIAFHDAMERDLGQDGRLAEISDLASKLADNMARLAALFQIAIDGPNGVVTEMVGVEATQGAIAVVGWHLNEAQRFLGKTSTPEHMQDAESILDWMRKKRISRIGKRDLNKLVTPVSLRKNSDRFHAALDDLIERGAVAMVEDGRKQMVELV